MTERSSGWATHPALHLSRRLGDEARSRFSGGERVSGQSRSGITETRARTARPRAGTVFYDGECAFAGRSRGAWEACCGGEGLLCRLCSRPRGIPAYRERWGLPPTPDSTRCGFWPRRGHHCLGPAPLSTCRDGSGGLGRWFGSPTSFWFIRAAGRLSVGRSASLLRGRHSPCYRDCPASAPRLDDTATSLAPAAPGHRATDCRGTGRRELSGALGLDVDDCHCPILRLQSTDLEPGSDGAGFAATIVGLLARLGRHGRRGVPERRTVAMQAPRTRMAARMAARRGGSWTSESCCTAPGDGISRTCFVGRAGRPDPAAALRAVPSAGAGVVGAGRSGPSDHAEAAGVAIARGVLGPPLELGIPAVVPRFRLQAAPSTNRPNGSDTCGLLRLGADPRTGDFGAGVGRLRATHDVLPAAGFGRCRRTIGSWSVAWLAAPGTRAQLHLACRRHPSLRTVSSGIHRTGRDPDVPCSGSVAVKRGRDSFGKEAL